MPYLADIIVSQYIKNKMRVLKLIGDLQSYHHKERESNIKHLFKFIKL